MAFVSKETRHTQDISFDHHNVSCFSWSKNSIQFTFYMHVQKSLSPQTGWSIPGFSNFKHTPFSYFLCNSPSKFQVCFIFYPPLGKPCQWLGEAKITWFSDRNLLRSTMGANGNLINTLLDENHVIRSGTLYIKCKPKIICWQNLAGLKCLKIA